MSENKNILNEVSFEALPEGSENPPFESSKDSPSAASSKMNKTKQKLIMVLGIIGAIVLVAALIFGVIYLVNNEGTATTVRDIFIILVALEFMLVGWVLIILVVQLAKLLNMLQNEIQPMIDSTNEAVNTIRGTSIFISENITDPIIKLNSYVAGLNQITNLFSTNRKKRKE